LHVVCIKKILVDYECEPLYIWGNGVFREYKFEPSPEEVLDIGLAGCINMSFADNEYSYFIVF
jgi:hypothetical protein